MSIDSPNSSIYVDSSEIPSMTPSVYWSNATSFVPSVAPSDSITLEGSSTINSSFYSSNSSSSTEGQRCPMGKFSAYTALEFDEDFVTYPLPSTLKDPSAGDVLFRITNHCEYIIAEDNRITHTFDNLELWFDHLVPYFGGIPRTTNGARWSGMAAPTMMDVKIERISTFFEVHISAKSPSVHGDKPIMWGFPNEHQAEEFEYFVLSMIRFVPEVFLTGRTLQCGSGPFCSVVGDDICSYNPIARMLEVHKADGTVANYDNSMDWFKACARSMGCHYIPGGSGVYMFVASPTGQVRGTRFVLDHGVDDGVLEWECRSVPTAHQLFDWVQSAALDPFRPLTVGGPFQRLG